MDQPVSIGGSSLPAITPKASAFIDLVLEGCQPADAADIVGVKYETALAWLRDEDIIDYIAIAAENRLNGAKAEAAGTLVRLLRARSEKVRLEAAKAVLGRSDSDSGARVGVWIDLGG